MAKKAKWEPSPWAGSRDSRLHVGGITIATLWANAGWTFTVRPVELDASVTFYFESEDDAKKAAVAYVRELFAAILRQLP